MDRALKTIRARAGRAGGVVAAALFMGTHVAAVAPAGADPAVTTHNARDFSVRPLPCAPDPGYFAVTVTYNETSRTSGDANGHFTQTGTFSAVPVEVTLFLDIPDDDHDHAVPVEWRARTASEYSGRVTSTGTSNESQKSSTTTFSVRIHASGSGGERFSLHYLSHATEAADGSTSSSFDRERCDN
ncbi:MAG TPA: hypothetical protein VM287_07870 [Egibacteraceae bacterium]|jgi:hypothetical protein|nr:hypothetical protein [Egibacteraceae bacterium]